MPYNLSSAIRKHTYRNVCILCCSAVVLILNLYALMLRFLFMFSSVYSNSGSCSKDMTIYNLLLYFFHQKSFCSRNVYFRLVRRGSFVMLEGVTFFSAVGTFSGFVCTLKPKQCTRIIFFI